MFKFRFDLKGEFLTLLIDQIFDFVVELFKFKLNFLIFYSLKLALIPLEFLLNVFRDRLLLLTTTLLLLLLVDKEHLGISVSLTLSIDFRHLLESLDFFCYARFFTADIL